MCPESEIKGKIQDTTPSSFFHISINLYLNLITFLVNYFPWTICNTVMMKFHF